MSLLSRIVCCEIRVVLINCIVGKVNERIVKRLQFVLLCSKAAQTIFVDEHAQRLYVGHEHVDSQIELIVVYQEWSTQVFLNDKVLIRVNRFNTLSNEYTFPLTHAFWLNYEVDFGPFLVRIIYVVFELIHLIWKEPCLWEEFIVPWKLPLHFLEITCQIVFASYLEHSWKMIDSLMRFDLLKHL